MTITRLALDLDMVLVLEILFYFGLSTKGSRIFAFVLA